MEGNKIENSNQYSFLKRKVWKNFNKIFEREVRSWGHGLKKRKQLLSLEKVSEICEKAQGELTELKWLTMQKQRQVGRLVKSTAIFRNTGVESWCYSETYLPCQGWWASSTTSSFCMLKVKGGALCGIWVHVTGKLED